MENYTKWIWHGEGIQSRRPVTVSRTYESYGDSMDTNNEDDVENDKVHEMIEDVEDLLMHQPEVLEHLVDDSKKLLYPGCSDQFTRLSTTLKLCKLKVKNGWSDKSFTEMLKLLADILPPKNELPTSTYEAKKILCPMGMNVKKIHACPNDCRKDSFDGTVETRVARLPLTGKEVFQRVKDIDRSIFWDLPYWEHLQVRHCLDFMHIEKNVCESIIGTLLNIPGKTKDGMKARLDLQQMGVRAELAPQQKGKRTYLPPACFTLSRKEKISFCECLSTVKVPSGYSSNPKNFWSIVLQSKRRIIGIDNVEDEDEYNQFDDNPPFSVGIQTTTLREDNVDINYARNDHDEGVWIDGQA
ncbi:hypothetical protein DCAR_0102217 [Daucus carota subsp. sativus]|uniref:Uncharacterized protein n=1 Tax=Daucus carota subsp. sativus TaxID=79200 RepID=A0AAF0W7F4_DAUCS|nr:hypothetical protein DCAR_0102217 [Daucus carota subsp. sativus]